MHEIQVFLVIVVSMAFGRLLPGPTDAMKEALALIWDDLYRGIDIVLNALKQILVKLKSFFLYCWVLYLLLKPYILRMLQVLFYAIIITGIIFLLGPVVWQVIMLPVSSISEDFITALVLIVVFMMIIGFVAVLAHKLFFRGIQMLMIILAVVLLAILGMIIAGILGALIGIGIMVLLMLMGKWWLKILSFFAVCALSLLSLFKSCSPSDVAKPVALPMKVTAPVVVTRPHDEWEVIRTIAARNGDGCIRITRRGGHEMSLRSCEILSMEYNRKIVNRGEIIMAPIVGQREVWYLMYHRQSGELRWIPQHRTVN